MGPGQFFPRGFASWTLQPPATPSTDLIAICSSSLASSMMSSRTSLMLNWVRNRQSCSFLIQLLTYDTPYRHSLKSSKIHMICEKRNFISLLTCCIAPPSLRQTLSVRESARTWYPLRPQPYYPSMYLSALFNFFPPHSPSKNTGRPSKRAIEQEKH